MTDPLISIVMPSFNHARYLKQAIASILDQGDSDVEVIVIDGGSTDGSVEFLQTLPDSVNWVSEHDGGQADALNKGFALARGGIIGWLNSDDFFKPGVFNVVRHAFEDPDVGWIVGQVRFFFEEFGLEVTQECPVISLTSLLCDPDIVRQQGAFYRRSMLEKVGGWDAQLHLAMDFDLWVRLSRIVEPLMIRHPLACFRIHAGQKTSAKNIIRQVRELVRTLKREHAENSAIYRLVVRKGVQAVKFLGKVALIRMKLLDARFEHCPLSLREVVKATQMGQEMPLQG
jgi:glycosyltransferase involved in cell wall biosynthesis